MFSFNSDRNYTAKTLAEQSNAAATLREKELTTIVIGKCVDEILWRLNEFSKRDYQNECRTKVNINDVLKSTNITCTLKTIDSDKNDFTVDEVNIVSVKVKEILEADPNFFTVSIGNITVNGYYQQKILNIGWNKKQPTL